MAKNIEYEEEDELPKDLSNDEDLDFEDEETGIKPIVNGAEPRQQVKQPQPQIKKAQSITKPQEANKPAPIQPEQAQTPQQQEQNLGQLLGQLIAAFEELNARVTKIESDLYRTRQ